jgi:hypothetical protein
MEFELDYYDSQTNDSNAKLSNLYSGGSHAKAPIPTATSLTSGKLMMQSRHKQKIIHQENYHTDIKQTKMPLIKGNPFQEEDDDELELRRFLPATPRDDLGLQEPRQLNLFRDSLRDLAPSVFQHQHQPTLTPAPPFIAPFIRDEG